jgi:hypothetical protein
MEERMLKTTSKIMMSTVIPAMMLLAACSCSNQMAENGSRGEEAQLASQRQEPEREMRNNDEIYRDRLETYTGNYFKDGPQVP